MIGDPFIYHWLPLAAEEVSTTEPPWQNVVDPPEVIAGVEGAGFTVTGTPMEAAEEQPLLITSVV